MTENEVLIKTPEEAIETIKSNMPTSGYQMLRESLDMAIIALKEIQQYREIGTVEECRELASIINMTERNELAKVIDEWLKYSKIGTVEECREATKKQKAKKPEVIDQDFDYYKCPVCGEYIWATDNINDHKYCLNCGQAVTL